MAEANLNICAQEWSYYPFSAHQRVDCPIRVNGLETATISRRDKWQIRPAKCDANENWRDRERLRLVPNINGASVYQPVPWADHPAWVNLLKHEPYASHFAHISTKDEIYISFTPSDEYGKYDRQLKMTPGRYLNKYCPDALPEDKSEWMRKWIGNNSDYTIFCAMTPVEIRAVYEHGPGSCMSNNKNRFWGEGSALPHPVEAYAGGDLGVAYLKRKIKKDQVMPAAVTARVVVWPAKKIMGPKVYGHDAHLLRMLLEDEGYTAEKHGFHGARLAKMPYPRQDHYIVPYIDGARALL